MNNQYSIKTNSKGRNILIVKGILPIDEICDIKAEDFDVNASNQFDKETKRTIGFAM